VCEEGCTPISQRDPENPAGQRQVPSTQAPPLKQGLVLQGPVHIERETQINLGFANQWKVPLPNKVKKKRKKEK
jgi:hypothetical protein